MNDTIKVEQWNGFDIRWIAIDDEWWAVGNDVANALGYSLPQKAITDHVDIEDMKTLTYKAFSKTEKANLWEGNDYSDKTLVSELGIYSLIFSSQLPEAKQFKRWVFTVIQKLRKAAGLEQYEVDKVASIKFEKDADGMLSTIVPNAQPIDFIKAKTIADKATSNQFGLNKMIRKAQMPPAMKKAREQNYVDVLQLMKVKRDLGLDMSISKTIYNRKAM